MVLIIKHAAIVAAVGVTLLGGLASPASGREEKHRRPRPTPAPAQDPEAAAKQRARALLLEGNTRLDEGLYVDALDKFQRAYDVYPSPKLHFNLAQTYHELGRPVEALRHYELFVRDVKPEEMPDKWALANERIFQ